MRRGTTRCSQCHKITFRTYAAAARVVHRTDAERPYWCKVAGGYHITGLTRQEFDHQQAERLSVQLSV